MKVSQNSFSRKKPDQLVYLELGSGNGGMLLSLSEDGFRFRAVTPLRPDGLVPFAFSFDGKARLQGVGEVEWLEDDGKSGALRFTEVSSEFRSAIDQWLSVESAPAKSEREVTPAVATPLDTMEKIREELRRGYPQRPTSPQAREESREELSKVPTSGRESGAEKARLPSQPSQPGTNGGAGHSSHDAAGHHEVSSQVEKKQDAHYSPCPANAESERREKPKTFPSETAPRTPHVTGRTDRAGGPNHPARAERQSKQSSKEPAPTELARADHGKTDRDRSSSAAAKPFYPPPFTHAAEPDSTDAAESQNSAFLKKPASSASPTPPRSETTESAARRSAFNEPQHAAPHASEPQQTREQAHASTESLRRPFRPESRQRNPDRPYIPPVDESFEAAWERAKLTAPPESPHLSRAAAGSIIGIALAVILGALAFNFRQDIGELVIATGQRISGESHNTSPVPSVAASENRSDAQPNAASGGGESAGMPNKSDPTAPQTGTTHSGANNPAGSNAAETGGQQSAASGTAHDATSTAPRDSTSSMLRNANPNGATSGTTNSRAATNGVATRPDGAATTSDPQAPESQEAAGNLATNIGTESGSGAEEFNAAREMLKGDHRHRDLSRAVNLLWAGVRKGYVPAEVTLADLYRRGDGVEKNCDQAQVLLVAASKKGSPEARQMLELMAEQGCSE